MNKTVTGKSFIALFLLLALAVSAHCAIIHVKTTGIDINSGLSWDLSKRTVQAGLNAAVAGDEVWVAAGTYVERISLKSGVELYGGFVATEDVRCERDWRTNLTVLDGDRRGSVVSSPSGATSETRIDGFTICNGKQGVGAGGGIYCVSSSPIICNNLITGNAASAGGGLYAGSSSSPTVLNNVFESNTAVFYGGGICCLSSSSPYISDNIFSANQAESGGGVYCHASSSSTISSNIMEANSARDGGAIYSASSSVTICQNAIVGNRAISVGGGIDCDRSSPTVFGNTIVGNRAAGGGGVCIFHAGSPIVLCNTISGNSANYGAGVDSGPGSSASICGNLLTNNVALVSGGGVRCYSGCSSVITNNSICGNTAVRDGGAIACASYSLPTVSNNIISSNGPGVFSAGAPVLRNNNVYGNATYDYSGLLPGTGDISADPLFLNVAAGDYRLLPDSPCVNAGWNDAPGLPRTDIDGEGRICWVTVDIGADELWPVRVQIDIRPGEWPNEINLRSQGVVPVAILTTQALEAATVDAETVTLAGCPVARRAKDGKVLAEMSDVDRDGDLDIVVRFRTDQLPLQHATSATLAGRTSDGRVIEGTDSVIVVPR